jgi:hypothetical protein
MTSLYLRNLYTDVFKVNEIRTMGGEFLFNKKAQILYTNTGTHKLVFSSDHFNEGDYLIVSGADTNGFYNIHFEVTNRNASGGNYHYHVRDPDTGNKINQSLFDRINGDDGATGISGNSLYINALDGGGRPYLDGYSGAEYSDGPFGDNSALTFRLGDLSGLPSSVVPSSMNPSGTGLFSTNVYMKGVIEAGSGTVVLDNSGISIVKGETNQNRLQWIDSNGDEAGAIWTYENVYNGENNMVLDVPGATSDTRIRLRAERVKTSGMPGYTSGSQSNSGTGEQDLFIDDVVNAVSTANNPAFSEISIASTLVGGVEYGDTITVINDGSKNFYFRDISDASRTNANIRTPGHGDQMLEKGGRTSLTYWSGNWYLNQDRR